MLCQFFVSLAKCKKVVVLLFLFTHIGVAIYVCAFAGLSRSVDLRLSFPAFQLLSIAVWAKVLCLGSAIEGAVLPPATFLLKTVHWANTTLPFGFVLPQPGMGLWVLVCKLQTVPDVTSVEAVGISVGLMFPGHVVRKGVYGINLTDTRHAGWAVVLRGQWAVLLGVGGTSFESAEDWLVRFILVAGWLYIDIPEMNDTVPLDRWGMAIVSWNRDWSKSLSTVTRGGERDRGHGGSWDGSWDGYWDRGSSKLWASPFLDLHSLGKIMARLQHRWATLRRRAIWTFPLENTLLFRLL